MKKVIYERFAERPRRPVPLRPEPKMKEKQKNLADFSRAFYYIDNTVLRGAVSEGAIKSGILREGDFYGSR